MTRSATAWLAVPVLALALSGCGSAGSSARQAESPASAAPSTEAVTTPASPSTGDGSPVLAEPATLLSARERGGAPVVAHETGTGTQRIARLAVSGEEPYKLAVRCTRDGLLGVEIDGRSVLESPCDGVRTVASVHADPGWDAVAVKALRGTPAWEIVIAAS